MANRLLMGPTIGDARQYGAAFHPHLLLITQELILRKGFATIYDSYSRLQWRTIASPYRPTGYLRGAGQERIF